MPEPHYEPAIAYPDDESGGWVEHRPASVSPDDEPEGWRVIAGMEFRIQFRGLRLASIILYCVSGVLAGIIIVPVLPYDARNIIPRAEGLLAVITLLTATCCGLLTPALATLSIARERERHTLDELLLTPFTCGELIGGKWLAVLRLISVLSLGPLVMMTVALLRGESAIKFFMSILVILAMVACLAAQGIFIATYLHRSGTALAVAYAVCGIWIFLLPALYWLSERWYIFRHITPNSSLLILIVPGVILFSLLRALYKSRQTADSTDEQRLSGIDGVTIWGLLLFIIPIGFQFRFEVSAVNPLIGNPLSTLLGIFAERPTEFFGYIDYDRSEFLSQFGDPALTILIQGIATVIFLVLARKRLEKERLAS